MKEKLRFLGLGVHAETMAVAIGESDGEVRSLRTIANREDSVRKFIKKRGSPERLRACYEAAPTGFIFYWQLAQLGVECAVVAPRDYCGVTLSTNSSNSDLAQKFCGPPH